MPTSSMPSSGPAEMMRFLLQGYLFFIFGFCFFCFSCFSCFCFRASLLFRFFAFRASLLFCFQLFCFSAFLASLFSASLLPLLFRFCLPFVHLCFSAFLLLRLSTSTGFSAVTRFCCSTSSCSSASLLPSFTVSLLFCFLCFILSCLYTYLFAFVLLIPILLDICVLC